MLFQIKMFHDEDLELRRLDKKLITISEIGVRFYSAFTSLYVQFMHVGEFR